VIRRLIGLQWVRYLIAGGLSAVVYYGLFAAGWLAVSRWVPYLLIAVLANLATSIATYPVYRTLVFRWTGPVLAGFLRWYAVCVWALAFGLGGLWTLVEVAGLHPLLAQAIIIVAGPVINYQFGKLWAFRGRRAGGTRPGDAPVPSARLAGLDDEAAGRDAGLGVPGEEQVQHLQR
jgi:putative flippase GtrA